MEIFLLSEVGNIPPWARDDLQRKLIAIRADEEVPLTYYLAIKSGVGEGFCFRGSVLRTSSYDTTDMKMS